MDNQLTDDEKLLNEVLEHLYLKESDFENVRDSFCFVLETIQNGSVRCLTTLKILSYLKEIQSFRQPKIEKDYRQAEKDYAKIFKRVWLCPTYSSEDEGK